MSLPAIAPLTAPAALQHADPLTDQAARWAEHVLRSAPHLPPMYVTRKALDAVAFSLRHGLRALSIPSKLVGVAAHQPAVQALAQTRDLPLAHRPRLVVSLTREAPDAPARLAAFAPQSDRSLARLGHVQPKHVAWLAPLLGDGDETCGASLYLTEVTGLGRLAQGLPVTLGVNVRIAGVGAVHAPPLAASRDATSGGGVRPTILAVRLWRGADGTARMTAVGDGEARCPHAARHSPTGPEWGYQGSGPADCARSVLLALTDEATAQAHAQAFLEDVIAQLPAHGAVIQQTAVLAWLTGQADSTRRPHAA